jgi:preprotein translocase subunit SecE
MAVESKITDSQAEDLPVEDSPKSEALKAEGKEQLKGKGLVLFIRQIISELKKVVAPTRQELREYTIVVLVFVLVIMLFITGVDVLIGQGVMALFAKN